MRDVLWVVEELQGIGGIGYTTVAFAARLTGAGIRLRVVTRGNAIDCWTAPLREMGVPVLVPSDGGTDPASVVACAREVCEADPPDLIQFFPLDQACDLWMDSPIPGIPVVALEPTDLGPGCWWYPAKLRRLVRDLDGIVVLTPAAADHAVSLGADPAAVFVIPNLVFDPCAPSPAPPADAPVEITCISRLSAEKGVDFAIAAFAIHQRSAPAAFLNLWGEGADRARLENLARMLGVADRVRFCGWFEPITGIDHVAARTTIGLLSSFFEGMPTALMELVARGVPVVSTRSSGAVEVLGEDYPWLSHSGDPGDLARHLRVLSENPVLRRETSERLWRRGRELCDGERVVEGFRVCYAAAAARGAARCR